MTKSESKSWKEALLKTSLPLEVSVAQKLGKAKFYVTGEFSYTRINEQGTETEFSVDIGCFDLLTKRRRQDPWADLNLLVECKYNHPSVRWVFAEHPNDEAIVTGVIDKFEELCTKRITNHDALYELDNEVPYCFKGVELHAKDANSQSVARGLHQLRWAVPHLVSSLLGVQASERLDSQLKICFVCPILVTNAPLYVLKREIDLNAVFDADELVSIANEVDALVVYQEQSPQYRTYSKAIFKKLQSRYPGIKSRLEELWPMAHDANTRKYLNHMWQFDFSLSSIGTHILVVNLESFDKIITQIRRSVEQSGSRLKAVGRLVTNHNGESKVEPVK